MIRNVHQAIAEFDFLQIHAIDEGHLFNHLDSRWDFDPSEGCTVVECPLSNVLQPIRKIYTHQSPAGTECPISKHSDGVRDINPL